jgi:pyruvate kinase
MLVRAGDLGMEIPSSKVPLAQKLLATECGLGGKFCVCATQMLESMIKNPRPTRAEMTDVANACIDGADCVMLSGETANGAFPIDAVKTMAAITQNTEQIVDHHRRFDFIRSQTPCPLDSAEGICSAAVQMAIDMEATAILCFTSSGRASQWLSKYRPPMPVFVVSGEDSIVAACRSQFGLHGIPMAYEEMTVCGNVLACSLHAWAWHRS